MRWKNRRRSDNVDDRRGRGGGARRPGGIVLILALLAAVVFKVDPSEILGVVGTLDGGGGAATAPAGPRADDELAAFTSVVLADTEDVWNAIFDASGKRYAEPKLVLFDGSVQSACGFASAAVGPFYCSGDETIYLDLSFFEELRTRHGAPGDFASAYVIAHEVGHHVQHLLGISDDVRQKKARASSEAVANDLSVRQELQADFLAGLWAHHAERSKSILEAGDVEEALGAAAAIGDDRLQMEARGYVVPDSFTHGSSEQRRRWFLKGLQTGDLNQGDTFSVRDP